MNLTIRSKSLAAIQDLVSDSKLNFTKVDYGLYWSWRNLDFLYQAVLTYDPK